MTQAHPAMRTLEMERDLKHPPAKVWRALTEGDLLAQWLLPNDFQPVVGHKFTFRGEPKPHWDGIIPAEVLAIEPPSRLVFRWYDWTVELTLTPSAAGTLLRMAQGDFGTDEAAYAGAKYGWTMFLGKLDEVLERL